MSPYDVALVALSVLAGGVAGLAGFGIGSLLTPALALTAGTKLAAAVLAVPHLIGTALRLWMLRSAIDRQVIKSFGIASAGGGLAGAILHASVSTAFLSIVLGTLLVSAGTLEFSGLARRLRFPGRWAIAAGIASGLFGGLVGNQGGIRAAALLRFPLSRQAIVATATASALMVDLGRVPVYLLSTGAELTAMSSTVVLLIAGVVLGTVVATPLLRRIPEPLFRRVLAILLLVLGVALISGLGR